MSPLRASVKIFKNDFDPSKLIREFVRCLQLSKNSSDSSYQLHSTFSAKTSWQEFSFGGRQSSWPPFWFVWKTPKPCSGPIVKMWPYLGKPGLMKIGLCCQCVDNGSKCICNVTQSHCKNVDNVQPTFKNGWKMFLNALETFPNIWSKCCTKRWKQGHFTRYNKADHKLSAQPIALCLQATNIQLNIKIVHLREFDFV